MREVFMGLIMIGLFAFAYYVVSRIGGFVDMHYRATVSKQDEGKTISVTFLEGKNAVATVEKIRKLGDTYDRCAVIVCGSEDSNLLDYINEEDGEYQYQIG